MGLLVTAAVTASLWSASATRDRERFDRLVREQVDAIRERLEAGLTLLRGASGLYAASREVTRADFSAYVAQLHLEDRYPGIRGLGYARRFAPGERETLARRLGAEGFPGIRPWPETGAAEPTSIVALEPLDPRNAAAIGFDMSSEPTRRAAMERARDEGGPALSGRVELVQEIDAEKQPGFLLYLPVYAGGAVPDGVAARRAALTGWVYAPFRAGDFFSRIAARRGAGGERELALAVFDGEDLRPDARLFAVESPAGAAGPGLSATRRIAAAGRTWTLSAAATPAFTRDPTGALAPAAAGIGLSLTLVLAGAAVAQTRAARRAEADGRALREETERLEHLNRAGSALTAEHDLGRLAQGIVDSATALIGAAYGAFFERVPAGREGNEEEVWRLFSLCGAPREAFTRFGLPRSTALFTPTFRAEGVVRADDVMAEGRYGSHGGMPKGHLPVRSYLAVPVVSGAGETLGALLFGHPEPARFGEREERLILGFAAQASIALDNARLLVSVRHEQDRFRAAVQAVRGVLWTNDAEGRMTGEQPGWSALTGQDRSQYEGYGWADAVHPEDAQPSIDAWNAAVAARRTFVFEHRVRSRDGTYRPYAIRAVPILEPDGRLREWVGVHTDISEQREAEAELRESNEEIQRYAYIVSHDLRAPLVNVMGFTSELEAVQEEIRAALGDHPRAAPIDADMREALGFIRAAITKMEALIAAILKLSREGRRSFRPEPLAMTALVQGLADAQRHQADAAGAVVSVAPDLPTITADRLAVEQIFANLLDNALKYLSPDRPGRIDVTAEAAPGRRVRFAVRDNGRGIAPQDHARIFDLFRRAGPQDRPGEGIGLAHVKALVRSLGGRIAVASRLGEGTTFTITLPSRPVEGAEDRGARGLAAE
ncbi:CHASE domain-containing protein [Methylobacterium sp. JK268]